jgi:hypothetical protein
MSTPSRNDESARLCRYVDQDRRRRRRRQRIICICRHCGRRDHWPHSVQHDHVSIWRVGMTAKAHRVRIRYFGIILRSLCADVCVRVCGFASCLDLLCCSERTQRERSCKHSSKRSLRIPLRPHSILVSTMNHPHARTQGKSRTLANTLNQQSLLTRTLTHTTSQKWPDAYF